MEIHYIDIFDLDTHTLRGIVPSLLIEEWCIRRAKDILLTSILLLESLPDKCSNPETLSYKFTVISIKSHKSHSKCLIKMSIISLLETSSIPSIVWDFLETEYIKIRYDTRDIWHECRTIFPVFSIQRKDAKRRFFHRWRYYMRIYENSSLFFGPPRHEYAGFLFVLFPVRPACISRLLEWYTRYPEEEDRDDKKRYKSPVRIWQGDQRDPEPEHTLSEIIRMSRISIESGGKYLSWFLRLHELSELPICDRLEYESCKCDDNS